MPRIAGFAEDRRDYLVVVGAAHLVGNQGLVALLRERGYTVTQQ
ncbi:MAG: TraB/GumN family protein [Thiohalorhabdaceae bacterium]